MTFQINSVYPWGRSLEEYARMFALSDADMHCRILDCGGGPASFNAEMTAAGRHVVSCDPLYQFTADEIRRRVEETHDVMVEKVRVHHDNFRWDYIKSPEHLGEIRLRAANRFLEDLEAGKGEARYVTAELPTLPFEDNSFELAVVSHLLFLYSEELTADFHLASIKELLRVAKEVRIFPLYAMNLEKSPHVQPVIDALVNERHDVKVVSVPYEFVIGANEMMVIKRALT